LNPAIRVRVSVGPFFFNFTIFKHSLIVVVVQDFYDF